MLLVCTAGFVEEMRFVAMKLHTKDQAPKEGGKEAAPQPFQKVDFHRLPATLTHIDLGNCTNLELHEGALDNMLA